jgi:hypothetical protein
MKGKWAKGMMACIGVLAASAQAGASPLFPGETVVPDASTVTGAFVTSVSGSFADGLGRISGTYMESVYRESTGSLSFVYQFANTGPDPLERMTGSAYGGFTTDVNFVAGSGSRDPLFADRTATPGDAPLLVDDYGARQLLGSLPPRRFTHAEALLRLELAACGGTNVDLERLMTRLEGRMPYDRSQGADTDYEWLLSQLKRSFLEKLARAVNDNTHIPEELGRFARHCIRHRLCCITFNYDDLLDRALWTVHPRSSPLDTTPCWTPDRGYGFPCRTSGTAVLAPGALGGPSAMELLKLHGSVNWRARLGQPRPYTVDAILHHERWFVGYGGTTVELGDLEPFLEREPFFVPPVLTKAALVEHPLLNVLWSVAYKRLSEATTVVFIAYSMPMTDVAGGFLFRESLQHLTPSEHITVVDFARSGEDEKKLEALLPAYRNVFPKITQERFQLRGVAEWVRNNI